MIDAYFGVPSINYFSSSHRFNLPQISHVPQLHHFALLVRCNQNSASCVVWHFVDVLVNYSAHRICSPLRQSLLNQIVVCVDYHDQRWVYIQNPQGFQLRFCLRVPIQHVTLDQAVGLRHPLIHQRVDYAVLNQLSFVRLFECFLPACSLLVDQICDQLPRRNVDKAVFLRKRLRKGRAARTWGPNY